ncbi:MAG: chorismate mutase, partial [Candidatus Sulfotelmatobacter sp.]
GKDGAPGSDVRDRKSKSPTCLAKERRDKGGAPAVTLDQASMDIEDWRKKIDELDRKLVELLSERAQAAVAIGRLKRETSLPIYEPDRERVVFANVQEANRGPLLGRDLVRIYERIIDVMRNVQKEEIVPKAEAAEAGTEFDSEVND